MRVLLRLLRPREDVARRALGRERVERRRVRTAIEELRLGVLLRTTHRDRLAVDHVRDLGGRVVQVTDEDRLDRADDDAGRLHPHVDAVRAEVALLRRVVLGVDEDRVVGAGGDARLAPDARLLVEVDDAVLALEHRARRAGGHARRVDALVAAGDLEVAAHLGEEADVDGLHVGARDADGHLVLRLARRRAGVAADAALLVDDLRPLDPGVRRGRGAGERQRCAQVGHVDSLVLPGASRCSGVPPVHGGPAIGHGQALAQARDQVRCALLRRSSSRRIPRRSPIASISCG